MAKFLTTNGISHSIENIILESKSKLTLVSPYLQLSKTLYERLKDASNRGVVIKVIYGKDELKPNERNSLTDFKNIELYFFENLHAKCYHNEKTMVITSMNMYEFSEKHNREMGVLIELDHDKELFEKAVEETNSILRSSERIPLRREARQVQPKVSKAEEGSKSKYQKYQRGYCIRCQARIDYNPAKPFCPTCYTIWSQFENRDYTENVCHSCGEFEQTSMNKPQCYNCFCVSVKAGAL